MIQINANCLIYKFMQETYDTGEGKLGRLRRKPVGSEDWGKREVGRVEEAVGCDNWQSAWSFAVRK